MDPALNPFTPGSGRKPHILAGRDPDLAAFDVLITRATLGLPTDRPLLLTGLRGVGKTVLLNEMHRRARAANWATIKFEATLASHGAKKARQLLIQGLTAICAQHRSEAGGDSRVRQMLSTLTSLQVSLGISGLSFGVERDPTRASSGILEVDIAETVIDVTTVIAASRRGFAIFVDEMQDLDGELLSALIATQHDASQQDLPFYLIGAGLPNLSQKVVDAASYAERMFNVRGIDRLSEEDARDAIAAPIHSARQSIHPDAVEALSAASGRYPYFIQELGSALWLLASTTPFTLADAEAAIKDGQNILDDTFFSTRWTRATPGERTYMGYMALIGGDSVPTAAISTQSKKPLSAFSTARASLISKGLIFVPERGHIAFTVPGFADYINRIDEADWRNS